MSAVARTCILPVGFFRPSVMGKMSLPLAPLTIGRSAALGHGPLFLNERMGGTPMPRGTGVSPVGSRDGSSEQKGSCLPWHNFPSKGLTRSCENLPMGPFLHMKSFLAKKGAVKPQWHLIDADGVVLGRLAVKVANLLRGRNKPTYTPQTDTGGLRRCRQCGQGCADRQEGGAESLHDLLRLRRR